MSKVLPGAEPFAFHGGPIGFLLIHGFTGSPGALRPMGEWLAARGHTVACPRLPGHGTNWQQLRRTRWQDWSAEATRALKDIDARVDTVVVFGLSFGAVLGLHLAARYPDAVRAVVLVNPWLRDRLRESSRYLKYVLRSGKGSSTTSRNRGRTRSATGECRSRRWQRRRPCSGSSGRSCPGSANRS
jgi:carboxylesterase